MCGINSSLINFNIKKFQLKKKVGEIKFFLGNKNYQKILEKILEFRNNYIFIEIIINKNKEVTSFLRNGLNKINKLKKKKFIFSKY